MDSDLEKIEERPHPTPAQLGGLHFGDAASVDRSNFTLVGRDQVIYSNTSNILGVQESGNYDDPTSKIWSVYNIETEKFDKALVESWKANMDAILIFAGLFSASLTAFIIESYKLLKPDSGDATTALLLQISQQLALMSNGSQASAAHIQTFSPASSTLYVNAFWFLSLGFSLLCALTATLVQQWARHYLQAIDRRPSPQKRARIRSYLYSGIKDYRMAEVVEGIPTLLHISVFLFFAGLVQFLLPIDHTIAYVIVAIVAFFALLYIAISFGPAFIYNFPYRSPLSGICWTCTNRVISIRWYGRSTSSTNDIKEMDQIADIFSMKDTYERDKEALHWTINSLTDDRELEPFVEGIPGYLLSDVANEASAHIRELTADTSISFLHRITGLLKTCTQPGSMAETAREKRATICLETITCLVSESGYSSSDKLVVLPADPELLKVLRLLASDKDRVIADKASRALEQIIPKLKQLAQELLNLRDRPGPMVVPHALCIHAALDGLPDDARLEMLAVIADSLHQMFDNEEQSTKAGRRTSSFSNPIALTIALGDFIHEWLIPQFLSHVPEDPELALDISEERLPYAVACLKLISLLPGFKWDPKVYTAISQLKKIESPLKFHAIHAATQLAIVLQSDITCAMWTPKNITAGTDKDLFSDGKSKLVELDMLSRLADEYLWDKRLQQLKHELQLSVQLRADIHFPDLVRVPGQLQVQIQQLGIGNNPSLSQRVLSLSAAYGNDVLLPPIGKLLLTRGRIAVLTVFVHAIDALPTSDESPSLSVILSTLRGLVSGNLEACFASSETQSLLVDIIRKRIRQLNDSVNSLTSEDERETVIIIIDTLIGILGTVGDPDTAKSTQAFLEACRNTVERKNQPKVDQTLNKLKSSVPFAPLPLQPAVQRADSDRLLRQLLTTIESQFLSSTRVWTKFKPIPVEDRKTLRKAWKEFANRKTQNMEVDVLEIFFLRLTGVFECRAYPSEHSIPNILDAWQPKENRKKASELEASDFAKLYDRLDEIDFAGVRERKKSYARLYHEARMTCEQGQGAISYQHMLLLLSFHMLSPDPTALTLQEHIVRTSISEVLDELVAIDRARSVVSGLICRHRYKKMKAISRAAP